MQIFGTHRRRGVRPARGGVLADRRGFSLIELIIGVLILSIIVAPLMHSMVTSARLSQKSRRLRDATLATENVVESVLARGLDSLLTGFSMNGKVNMSSASANVNANTEAKLYYTDESGAYIAYTAAEVSRNVQSGDRDDIYYIGITGVATSAGTYDAMVRLDATEFGTINDNYISVYTGMDGAFSQPSADKDNPDKIAAAYFAELAGQLTGTTVKVDDPELLMNREVVMNIEKVPDSEGATTGVMILTATLSYSASYKGDILNPLDPWTLEFYRCMYDETTGEGIGSIFFFYYPHYGRDNVSYTGVTCGTEDRGDTIKILNNSGSDLSLFLVKQKTDSMSLSSDEDAYNPSVYLFEPYAGTDAPMHCSICTNIATNLVTGKAISLFPNGISVNLCATYSGSVLLTGTRKILNSLVYTEKLNRLYDVRVTLYEAGRDFAADAKITEFNSSQVE